MRLAPEAAKALLAAPVKVAIGLVTGLDLVGAADGAELGTTGEAGVSEVTLV